jgi:uncharacterized integral membrane protein
MVCFSYVSVNTVHKGDNVIIITTTIIIIIIIIIMSQNSTTTQFTTAINTGTFFSAKAGLSKRGSVAVNFQTPLLRPN